MMPRSHDLATRTARVRCCPSHAPCSSSSPRSKTAAVTAMPAIVRNVRLPALLFPWATTSARWNQSAARRIRGCRPRSAPLLCHGPRRRQEPQRASATLSGFAELGQRADIVMLIVPIPVVAVAAQRPSRVWARAADPGCRGRATPPACADGGGDGDGVCAPCVAGDSCASHSNAGADDYHD